MSRIEINEADRANEKRILEALVSAKVLREYTHHKDRLFSAWDARGITYNTNQVVIIECRTRSLPIMELVYKYKGVYLGVDKCRKIAQECSRGRYASWFTVEGSDGIIWVFNIFSPKAGGGFKKFDGETPRAVIPKRTSEKLRPHRLDSDKAPAFLIKTPLFFVVPEGEGYSVKNTLKFNSKLKDAYEDS